MSLSYRAESPLFIFLSVFCKPHAARLRLIRALFLSDQGLLMPYGPHTALAAFPLTIVATHYLGGCSWSAPLDAPSPFTARSPQADSLHIRAKAAEASTRRADSARREDSQGHGRARCASKLASALMGRASQRSVSSRGSQRLAAWRPIRTP